MLIQKLELNVTHIPHFKGWNHIQKNANAITGNLMLSAPTGKGKTEAALLWANSNLNSGKILYLLPTRVTVNAMYYRLRNILVIPQGYLMEHQSLKVAEDEKME